jgi:hypothetical protein
LGYFSCSVHHGTTPIRIKGRLFTCQVRGCTGNWKFLYRKSKTEARKALRQALKECDEGIIPPSKMTVGAMLDGWRS